MDTGKRKRLDILTNDAENDIISKFKSHHWECEIIGEYPNGEYIIIKVSKGNINFKIGFLYSCATANSVYKTLDKIVDLIILNGTFYHLKSYAYGITKDVIEKKDLQKFIILWNSKASDGKVSVGGIERPLAKPKEFNSIIQSEVPINQIWSRIKQFKTKGLAKKLIEQRCNESSCSLDPETIENKATGLSYTIQNACDYFEAASSQKLNQRIVNLYYGTIAFASSEMLASPTGPNSLQHVEEMTKFGHGLYTFDSLDENKFEGFIVGVLSNGFFKKWSEFLNHNVASYPQRKPRKSEDIDISSNYTITLIELLSRIPEIEDLFRMVTDTPINWLNFNHDSGMNGSYILGDNTPNNTYVKITDISCSKTIDDIAKIDLPIEQIEYTESEFPGLCFKALIKHPEKKYWHQAINLHHSPFTASSYIIPIFGDVSEYRCIATVLLYALSILVRYRPSIWREVESGKHENYLALVDEFLSIYERIGPELFLEAILNKKIHVIQSGSMFAQM